MKKKGEKEKAPTKHSLPNSKPNMEHVEKSVKPPFLLITPTQSNQNQNQDQDQGSNSTNKKRIT